MNTTHSTLHDLTGQRFGKGLVLRQTERPINIIRQGRFWLVQCDCGREISVEGNSLKKGTWKSCGCIHEQDLKGRIFGLGTVIDLMETRVDNNRIWLLRCECGLQYKASTNSLMWKNKKSCGCLNYITGKKHHRFKGYEEITGNYWSKLQRGAAIRNIVFDISIEFAWQKFVDQNKKCALTGWPIKLSHYGKQTASVDRIDSLQGYLEKNIQWLHKDVNRMKFNFPEDYFISVCKAVNSKEKPLE
jgi:hypothetical protein